MTYKKNVRIVSLFILSEIISHSTDTEEIKQKILSDTIDWLSVVEIANTHFLTASLYYSLLDKDILNLINDEELIFYLEQIYTTNLERNLRIIEQSKKISQILLEKDIKPVFLKGTASLLQNDYKDIGMRFLSDIDFCVSENDFIQAKEQLISFGYIPDMDDPGMKDIEKHHHWWTMYHPNWEEMGIEIHRAILTFPYSDLIDCKESNCQNVVYHSNMVILSPTYRLIHTYIHSDIVDRSYTFKKIDLRQLYEMSKFIDNYKLQINWKYIEEFFKKQNMWHKFYCRLSLIDALFEVHAPVLRENKNCRISLKLFYMFFEDSNTFFAKQYIRVQDFRIRLSSRQFRKKNGEYTKRKHYTFIAKYLLYRIIFMEQFKKGFDKLKKD